jgi:hypothetical protein
MAKKVKAKKKVKKAAKKKAVKSRVKVKAKKGPAGKSAAKAAKGKKGGRKKKTLPELEPQAPHLPWRDALPGETLIGVVDDFFGHIGVITMTLQESLKVGQRIHVRGNTTDIVQTVSSMQIEHQPVSVAKTGDGIGIKSTGKARRGDYVYLTA